MSSAIALVVLPLLLHSVQATFPPVVNPPPIPSQAVRTLDISGQRVYIQSDLQPNQPQTVIKEEEYFPIEDKLDQRWFAPENQSEDTVDYPNPADIIDRYYSDGQPAIGPVATPLPDDNYVAQPSITSKVIPDGTTNVGSSDIWVLTKGPNDQYVPERWVQIQVPQDRVVEVVNPNIGPKQLTETVKSFPSLPAPPPPPIKASSAAPPNAVQQVWIKSQAPIQSQKVIQNTATVVEEIPSVKQYSDIPQPGFKQYIQPQIVKEAQPLPPPPPPPAPTIVRKSSSFIVPPPPPPPININGPVSPKQTFIVNQPPVGDQSGFPVSPKQTFIVNQPPVGDQSGFPVSPKQTVLVNQQFPPVRDQVGLTVGKDGTLSQVKHIWVPTSHQTGKFITVPVGTVIDGGKFVPSKGIPVDVPSLPISVSDTWILKQDGPIPRFEQQKSFGSVIQKGNVIADDGAVIRFDSPKNPPLVGKSIDTTASLDIWPAKSNVPDQKTIGKFPGPQQIQIPFPSGKSDTIIVGKGAPISPPQKTIISSVKSLTPPPPPPPQIVAPVPQFINGKPCPIGPQKSLLSPKSVPLPRYRTVAINRQPFGRILRINRYPYGSYYVLNPRIGPSLYAYPKVQGPMIQQTKNGVVRLVSARQLGVPFSPRPLAVPVTRKQIILPISNGKSAAPVLQPQILYPPVSRIRYAYPWGSYIRSLPVAGKNIFVLPPNQLNKPAKIQKAKSSSSESSSSESSSSESKSAESKPKEVKKEEEAVAESIESIESAEPELEKEDLVEEEVASSEAEPEAEEEAVSVAESEAHESIEVEESQIKPQFSNRGVLDSSTNNFNILPKPFPFGFDQQDLIGSTQHHKQTSDSDGRVVGSYGFRYPDGRFRNVAYVADAGGYRAHVVSNEPGTISHKSADVNFISNTSPESTTQKRVPEMANDATHESLTAGPQRD